jgi:short-subunit dehydrogenase involved in D-alanine esterification of teichoic acids
LVNNAEIAAFGGILEQAPEDWDRVIETNLNAWFLLSKLALVSMVKRRRGKIITIASMYAVFGAAFAPSYIAAKGAVVELTNLTESVKTTPGYQEAIAWTRPLVGLIPTNAPARPCFWRPLLRILSPGQSSW